jgi:hypothetical protein
LYIAVPQTGKPQANLCCHVFTTGLAVDGRINREEVVDARPNDVILVVQVSSDTESYSFTSFTSIDLEYDRKRNCSCMGLTVEYGITSIPVCDCHERPSVRSDKIETEVVVMVAVLDERVDKSYLDG